MPSGRIWHALARQNFSCLSIARIAACACPLSAKLPTSSSVSFFLFFFSVLVDYFFVVVLIVETLKIYTQTITVELKANKFNELCQITCALCKLKFNNLHAANSEQTKKRHSRHWHTTILHKVLIQVTRVIYYLLFFCFVLFF